MLQKKQYIGSKLDDKYQNDHHYGALKNIQNK
jgi:hypothetical protein